MKNILVPGSANIFSDQNGKDVYVSINRHGMMRLQVEAEPQDSDEADFLSLPEGD